MAITVYVNALVDKNQLISALRALTTGASRFDPYGWSIGDAEDLEAAAGLIRREVAGAEIRRAENPATAISLEQARREHRCRLCGEAFPAVACLPYGLANLYVSILRPVQIVLNFGTEYAHPECMRKAGLAVPEMRS